MTLQAWLAVSGVLIATGAGIIGFTIGRAFYSEERYTLELENITLRGHVDAAAIKARAIERRCLELQAALHHRKILEDGIRDSLVAAALQEAKPNCVVEAREPCRKPHVKEALAV